MTITLRTQSATGTSTKGSTLTHAELDDNFIDLLQNKIKPLDVRGDTGTELVGQSLSNEILQVVGGTGISTAVTSDSAGQARITITNTSVGGSITDDTSTNSTHYVLFDDVTTGAASSVKVSSTKLTFNPSSGLFTAQEISTDSIVSKSANAAISITPNGTGDVQLNADTVRLGDQNSNATLTTYGTGDLIISTNEGTNSGTITIFDGTNANIEITPNGTGQVKIDYSLWPASDGTATQVLSTNGSGVLSWTTASTFAPASPGEIGATTPDIGNFTDLKVKSASSTVKELQLYDQDNSNYVGFKSPTTVSTNKVWVLPNTDGTNGQMLTTDGTANLSWTTASGGVTLSDDTSTNATRYIIFDDSTTGSQSAFNVSSTKLTFNPSTGTLSTTVLSASSTIELGHATDTTLSRVSAGRIAVEGVNVVTISSTDTLTNKTLTAPVISSISNTGTLTLPTTTGTLGYQNLPAVGTKTTSYTLTTSDVGKYVQVGSGGSITIPNSTFAEGDVVVIVNNHTAAITITCTITDAYIGGVDTDKASVSLATRGVCNILFVSGTRCIITGNVS